MLVSRIGDDIRRSKGWISFAHFMDRALYAPGLGYYSGGAHKLGAAGDFVTAPELGPLFAQTLAAQVAEICALSDPHIIEVGAGSGRLAADLLRELAARQALPESYRILEVSGELRARQQAALREVAGQLPTRINWLDRFPEHFSGIVLANEVLDAMPVHLVVWQDDDILERGVGLVDGQFVWQDRPASGRLRERAQTIAAECSPPPGYLGEIALLSDDWLYEWGQRLTRGALLLLDYGFPRHEYYHAQRSAGTLMCHYRHRAHGDPFYLPGLQDITAHVDFTAIAEAACAAGFELLGYTTQAGFLLACGLLEILARTPAEDAPRYLPLANAAQKLISPAEMGELFKVMALGKGIGHALLGFQRGERSHTL